MSVGNIKNNGNKGNNFPYQHNLLKGIQKLVDSDQNDVLKVISNILSSTLRKPGRSKIDPGTVGTIPAGFRSWTIKNIGTDIALVDGEPLYPGEIESYDAGSTSDVLDEISYDTQATTLLIITIA